MKRAKIHKNYINIFRFTFVLLASLSANRTATFAAVKSQYTDVITKLASESAKKEKWGSLANSDLIKLECIETEGNDLYMGVSQFMIIDADLAAVESVLLDIDHYKDLFPGYKETKITSREGNKIMTFWEQRVPILFVPNVKYEMIYWLETPTPDQRLFRYQLEKPTQLKVSDGFILLRKTGEHQTQYLEYDFFDADWGLAKIAGKTKLWSDAVEGLVHSDLAAKFKAENASWQHEKARDEAEKKINSKQIDECVKNKVKLK